LKSIVVPALNTAAPRTQNSEPGTAPRVLIIAFHFPPEGGSSGVLRTLKFAKYLLEFGWTPVVLTAPANVYPSTDPKLLEQVPGEIEVHRAWCLDLPRLLSVGGRYPELTAIPDRYSSWWLPAVLAGSRLIKSRGCQAIFSTSPIPTAHLIALTCKRLCGIPWIADFRDPWIEERQYSGFSRSRDAIERRLERWVLRRADRVTATTRQLREELLARHSRLVADRVTVIPNGYDEEDFAELPSAPAATPTTFELVHTGLVTDSYRSPLPLFKAVERLIAESLIPEDQIKIAFYGGGGYLSSAGFRDAVTAMGLTRVVQVHDRVPYLESLEKIRSAAVLLVLQGGRDTSTLIPAKAFEYVRSGRPILALTEPDGATAELILECGAGRVVALGDVDGIKANLLAFYREFCSGALMATRALESFSARYSRRSTAATLADLLSQLTVPARPVALAAAR
jgi:glycosyltransferase involved in cell wall biosynthesis